MRELSVFWIVIGQDVIRDYNKRRGDWKIRKVDKFQFTTICFGSSEFI